MSPPGRVTRPSPRARRTRRVAPRGTARHPFRCQSVNIEPVLARVPAVLCEGSPESPGRDQTLRPWLRLRTLGVRLPAREAVLARAGATADVAKEERKRFHLLLLPGRTGVGTVRKCVRGPETDGERAGLHEECARHGLSSTQYTRLLEGEDERTTCDPIRVAERIRARSYPQADDFAAANVLNPPPEERMLDALTGAELRHS